MSINFLIRKTVSAAFTSTIKFQRRSAIDSVINCRHISLTGFLNATPETESEEKEEETEVGTSKKVQEIPVETSIRYLKSTAYQKTYGLDPVWKQYRRNHKGQFPPLKTRKTCIRKGEISTGNPCPICRDEYLVLRPENTELLKQFISPYTGLVLSYSVTGLCQKRFKELCIAVEIAKDKGLITFDVPFREYDYSEYIKKNKK